MATINNPKPVRPAKNRSKGMIKEVKEIAGQI
jgi:hypothetical protein